MRHDLTQVTNYTSNYFWVEFGIAYNASGNRTFAQADMFVQLSMTQCGMILGTTTQQVDVQSTTDNKVLLLTDWFPMEWITKVGAAISVEGVTGNPQCKLMYQAARVSPQVPGDVGSYTAVDVSYHTGGGDFVVPQTAITDTTNMWCRLVLYVDLSSGTFGTGTYTVTTALRK